MKVLDENLGFELLFENILFGGGLAMLLSLSLSLSL